MYKTGRTIYFANSKRITRTRGGDEEAWSTHIDMYPRWIADFERIETEPGTGTTSKQRPVWRDVYGNTYWKFSDIRDSHLLNIISYLVDQHEWSLVSRFSAEANRRSIKLTDVPDTDQYLTTTGRYGIMP
jgi:hypothetical protein